MDLSFLTLAAGSAADLSNEGLFSAASITAFLTLTVMEVVLGIDNLVFVAILVDKLPKEKQAFARNLGLGLALILRLGLLFSASYIMRMTAPVIPLNETWKSILLIHDTPENPVLGFSFKDLILIGGGIFLLYKASKEIYEKLEGEHSVAGVHGAEEGGKPSAGVTVGNIIFQIILLDLVFSVDSVITAVGMIPQPEKIWLIVGAMLIAVSTMVVAAGAVGGFVSRHPSVKILALSFLNMIGVMLLLEGTHHHIDKGYIYASMAFSLLVEILNLRFKKKQQKTPVTLHDPHPDLEKKA